MSADLLREAAALMRERAAAVTQGAQWTGGNYWITDHDPSDPTGQTAMQRLIGGMDGPDADHYANLVPTVALAVADWLDNAAQDLDMQAPGGDLVSNWDMRVHIAGENALNVARTYLGRDA